MDVNVKYWIQLLLVIPIVYYFHGLTASFFNGIFRLFVVIFLSIILWVLLSKLLFLIGDSGSRIESR